MRYLVCKVSSLTWEWRNESTHSRVQEGKGLSSGEHDCAQHLLSLQQILIFLCSWTMETTISTAFWWFHRWLMCVLAQSPPSVTSCRGVSILRVWKPRSPTSFHYQNWEPASNSFCSCQLYLKLTPTTSPCVRSSLFWASPYVNPPDFNSVTVALFFALHPDVSESASQTRDGKRLTESCCIHKPSFGDIQEQQQAEPSCWMGL